MSVMNLTGWPFYTKELANHIMVNLSMPRPVLGCMPSVVFRPVHFFPPSRSSVTVLNSIAFSAALCCSNAMAAGQTHPAHCNRGSSRQLLPGTSNYPTCVYSPLSRREPRSCHVDILSVWHREWWIELFSWRKEIHNILSDQGGRISSVERALHIVQCMDQGPTLCCTTCGSRIWRCIGFSVLFSPYSIVST